jgi:catechol 2,3-dioxygenase-like lactoylglutathione lyase family enzyme
MGKDSVRALLVASHPVFPVPDMAATASYYSTVLGFRAVDYSDAAEPHVCLYRDGVEIILTRAAAPVRTNRQLYGYGYDSYFITPQQAELQAEFESAGAIVVKRLATTDYHNSEFVVEDPNGRWLAFGIKTV